jgi:hypothetical protein
LLVTILFDTGHALEPVFVSFAPVKYEIGEMNYHSPYDFMYACREMVDHEPSLKDIVADWITRDQLTFGAMVQLTKSEAPQVLKDMAAMKLEEVANV